MTNAKSKSFTSKDMAMLGGAGLVAYLLFSKQEKGISGGGSVIREKSIFETLKEVGSNTKEFVQNSSNVFREGFGIVGEGVGLASDVVKGVGEGLGDVKKGTQMVRAVAPSFSGISGTPSLEKKARYTGGGFIKLGGSPTGIIDIPMGIATTIANAKSKKESSTPSQSKYVATGDPQRDKVVANMQQAQTKKQPAPAPSKWSAVKSIFKIGSLW